MNVMFPPIGAGSSGPSCSLVESDSKITSPKDLYVEDKKVLVDGDIIIPEIPKYSLIETDTKLTSSKNLYVNDKKVLVDGDVPRQFWSEVDESTITTSKTLAVNNISAEKLPAGMITHGVLASWYCGIGDKSNPEYDVTETTVAGWSERYGQTENIGKFYYSAGKRVNNTFTHVIDKFNPTWKLHLERCQNNYHLSSFYIYTEIDFLSASDELIYTIRLNKSGGSHGTNASSLKSIPTEYVDGNPILCTIADGYITFEPNKIKFTNIETEMSRIASFECIVDNISDIAKISIRKMGGMCDLSGNYEAYMKLEISSDNSSLPTVAINDRVQCNHDLEIKGKATIKGKKIYTEDDVMAIINPLITRIEALENPAKTPVEELETVEDSILIM